MVTICDHKTVDLPTQMTIFNIVIPHSNALLSILIFQSVLHRIQSKHFLATGNQMSANEKLCFIMTVTIFLHYSIRCCVSFICALEYSLEGV